MRGVVYVDLLFLINALLGAFLLKCTSRLAGRACTGWRLLAGGAAAGLSSLVLLLPPLPGAVLWGVKLGTACAVVWAAFGWHGPRSYGKVLLWYVLLNLLLGGAVFAALYYGLFGGIEVHNFTLYFNVSPVTLLVCVGGVYLAVEFCAWAFGRPQEHPVAAFCVQVGGAEVRGTAMVDTGLRVRDPITGSEAFLLSLAAVRAQLPPETAEKLQEYFSEGNLAPPLTLVPTQSAGGVKLLPALPGKWTVDGKTRGRHLALFTQEALAGGTVEALVSPET